MTKLPVETIVTHISKCPGWRHVDNNNISKVFTFSNSEETGHFVYLVNKCTDLTGHYPRIGINSFDVSIELNTVEVNGVTGKDLLLAQKINQIEKEVKLNA